MFHLLFASAFAQGNALNPDIAFIADIAAAGFSGDPLQTGAHDPQQNGFNLQQLELSVGQAVDPYFRFDGNIVFAQFGVEIEEVYATTLGLPGGTQIRAGQFLTRFGRHNPTHPHTWDFADQPWVTGRVMGAEGNRGLGVEGSWLAPTPFYLELVVSETMLGGAATNRSWSDFSGVEGPFDLQTTASAKTFLAPHDDLSVLAGVSWAVGPNGTGRDNRSELFGGDVTLKYRPITRASGHQIALTSEWIQRRRQLPGELVTDWTGLTALTWRNQRVGLGARHELGTPSTGSDPLDPAWVANRHRWSGAATYWPTEFSRLRLQGARDTGIDAPLYSVFLAFEFAVGAHGSHAF
ncbi:MAG TPA: zinc-regulated TonB-dependent outer membrane receptor [Myxococcota bacterium]|nr:zinc-regulated TonB-dependent outer membrane receptor [Myxococcota bacterium]